MTGTTTQPPGIDARAREIATSYRDEIYRRTDRMFAVLLLIQ
ncbi:MAG TPA: hypothetical protein VMZ71_03585 [Gemmataceae bacterium]|nr:hypothetical protein [Gemmataceae bacterium]